MKGWICSTAAAPALFLSACADKPAPAPAAGRAPPVLEAQSPQIVPPPPAAGELDWRDRPLTPGDWSYDPGAGEARHGEFTLRCDSGRRRVAIAWAGARGPLRLHTSYGERTLPATGDLPADDPLLDAIAFSRGRFMVEAPGIATMVLPAWPEPARVVEDCRG